MRRYTATCMLVGSGYSLCISLLMWLSNIVAEKPPPMPVAPLTRAPLPLVSPTGGVAFPSYGRWSVCASPEDTMDTIYENLAETAFEKNLELPLPYFTIRMSENIAEGTNRTPAWFPGCGGEAPAVPHYFKDAKGSKIYIAAPSF